LPELTSVYEPVSAGAGTSLKHDGGGKIASRAALGTGAAPGRALQDRSLRIDRTVDPARHGYWHRCIRRSVPMKPTTAPSVERMGIRNRHIAPPPGVSNPGTPLLVRLGNPKSEDRIPRKKIYRTALYIALILLFPTLNRSVRRTVREQVKKRPASGFRASLLRKFHRNFENQHLFDLRSYPEDQVRRCS
jgi:hypothetical protein